MVRQATHKKTKEAVAVKILRLPPAMRALVATAQPPSPATPSDTTAAPEEEGALDEEDILKEVAILRDLESPFVIKLKGYYFGPPESGVIYLVQELLPGGPLLEALLAHEGAYSEREARLGFEALLRGLHYLHLRGITHRDVKLDNLLLARPADLSSAKLVDFGLAAASFEAAAADENGMRWMCGSASYMAPEVAGRKVPYTCAVDMWSAGVVLHLLLTGLTPFPAGADDEETLKTATDKRFAVRLDGPEWNNVSLAGKDLVTKLLTVKPESRINAARALMHPWISPPPMRPGSFRAVDGNLAHTMRDLRSYAAVRCLFDPSFVLYSRCLANHAHLQAAKLPVLVFPAGTLMSTKTDRAETIYLIRRGTVEVLVPLSAAESAQAEAVDAAAAAADEEGSVSSRLSLPRAPSADGTHYRLVATRGAGELVGDIGVVTDRDGRLSLTAAPAGGHSGLTPSPSMLSLSDSETPVRADEPPEGTAIDEWASIVLAKRFGKRWAGRTRVATLRAATAVEAVSLQRDTLRWVIEHDELLAREVEAFVKNQPGGSVHGGTANGFAALAASVVSVGA